MLMILQRRIHLDRPQMLLLAFCAFLTLVNVFLVATYLPADRQRDQLLTQVTTIERAVARLQARGATTGGQPPPVQPGENPFPRELPTAELTNLVVQSAQAAGVRLESITPQLGASEKLAYNQYRAYRVSLRAVGGPAPIADFLGRIEHGTVRTWVIDNLQARPVAGAPGTWDVTFDVLAYAQT
ncbi:MAG TPA: hypothetical protein VGM69_13895 [Chloroflexota bacterium]